MTTVARELYDHWSSFNFKPQNWRGAAERFLQLMEYLDDAYANDGEVDHDNLGDNFERCDVCEHIDELENYRDEFLKEFGRIWADHAVREGQ